ncbi:MAG: hypothetical protein KDB27_27200 [Planctomycetales bacterium]|nr:hypothetical protein [Planctomycetales bacterium]
MTSVDDSLLTKYGLSPGTPPKDGLDEQDLRPENYKAFGIDSQVRPSNAMIDFWLVDGSEKAFAYTHLYDAAYDPSSGIILNFSGHRVTLLGRKLHELYRAIKRHRVVYVWEADPPTTRLTPPGTPVITRIVIESEREVFEAGT